MSVLAQVDDWEPDHVSVAVVGPDGTVAQHGPADRSYPWASVTKLCTALTVLTLVEQGMLELDDPAGPPNSTVRHLLSHTSGLAFEDGAPGGTVGRTRIYSNLGFEALGQYVEDVTGRSFAEALDRQVLQPLGMAGTRLEGSPAAGLVGPIGDLARLTHELLRPTLLDADTMELATTVQFPGLSGVLPGFGRQEQLDWGLGFELRDGKQPHWTGTRNSPGTFGHFGGSGSFLWVDPDADLGCCELASQPFGDWCAERWPSFNDAVLDAYA